MWGRTSRRLEVNDLGGLVGALDEEVAGSDPGRTIWDTNVSKLVLARVFWDNVSE